MTRWSTGGIFLCIPVNKHLSLSAEFGEQVLGKHIKAAGCYWNQSRVWELAYKEVVMLGLSDRMVENEAETEM